ncbi:MAG: hypothetical protein VKJ46_15155 [Leptolyngbyaceae bacterium]|nr:hypothetical protein [Leptolyngbyaceae bacterium]
MVNALQVNYSNAVSRHQASIQASLAHRLEAAREANNTQLLALLEKEEQQLKTIPPSALPSNASPSLMANLKSAWQGVTQAIANSSELQVRQISDDFGVNWWYAYDPHTGHAVYTDSETEMRLWIEENY